MPKQNITTKRVKASNGDEVKKQVKKPVNMTVLRTAKKDALQKRGVNVRTPNYLEMYHLKTPWKDLVLEELEKLIRKNAQKLIESGNMENMMAKGKGSDLTEGFSLRWSKHKGGGTLRRSSLDEKFTIPYPKIETNAKQLLYKTMDEIGTDMVLGYAEQRKRSGQKVVSWASVIRQSGSVHGARVTRKLVSRYNEIYDTLAGVKEGAEGEAETQ